MIDFEKESDYINTHEVTKRFDEETLAWSNRKNPMLVRKDVSRGDWKLYTSTSPYVKPPQQNVLALGGFGKRKPYSYISDKFCYNTVHTAHSRIFEQVYFDKGFMKQVK